MPFANNKGADQPAHLRSLISLFFLVFFFFFGFCLDSINSRNFKTLTSRPAFGSVGRILDLKGFAALFISTPFGFKKSVVLCDVVKYNIFDDIHGPFLDRRPSFADKVKR